MLITGGANWRLETAKDPSTMLQESSPDAKFILAAWAWRLTEVLEKSSVSDVLYFFSL